MPGTITLTLQLEAQNSSGLHLGSSIHAVVLSLIAAIAPDLARQMHDAQPKPYSLALGVSGASGESKLELRVQVLHDTLMPLLLAVFRSGTYFGTSSDPLRGRLTGVTSTFEDYSSFVARVSAAPLERQARIEFLSSTALSGQGNTWALPIPSFLLSGLRVRFEKFSGHRFEGQWNAYINRFVTCSHHRVTPRTERISSKETHSGFTGHATFCATGHADSARAAALLLRFAEWSGVGTNTTVGCGQVRVALEPGRVRDESGEAVRVVRT